MSDENANANPGAENNGAVSDAERFRLRAEKFEGKVTDLEKQLGRFKNIDPDKYAALTEEVENLKRMVDEKEAGAAGNADVKRLERELQKIRETTATEKDTLQAELNKLRATNKTLQVTDKVMGKIGSKFTDDGQKWIKLEVERACDLEDGEIVVKDEHGRIRYGKKGLPMTVEEYADLLVEENPSLARPTGASGARDQGQKGATPRQGQKPKTWAELKAMPNPKEVLNSLTLAERKAILNTIPPEERNK